MAVEEEEVEEERGRWRIPQIRSATAQRHLATRTQAEGTRSRQGLLPPVDQSRRQKILLHAAPQRDGAPLRDAEAIATRARESPRERTARSEQPRLSGTRLLGSWAPGHAFRSPSSNGSEV
ncbi:unnamed protein product [Lampetra planeri]